MSKCYQLHETKDKKFNVKKITQWQPKVIYCWLGEPDLTLQEAFQTIQDDQQKEEIK